MDVKSIIAPVEDDLAAFEIDFKAMFESKIDIIDQIADHLIKTKGKRLRPALVLLAASTHGKPGADAIRVAAIIELIHTATLVHDDVVDEAALRRGSPSLNSIWDNHVSVLMGDYLLSRALCLIVLMESRDMMSTISKCTERLSKGELLQATHGFDPDISEEQYFNIISDKTASLMASGCEVGAYLTSGSAEIAESFRKYGECLGKAFQITDDVLDYVGDEQTIGKPTGNDAQAGTVTLPLIRALEKASSSENEQIRSLLDGEWSDDSWPTIVDFTHKNGGIEYARVRALEYSAAAKAELVGIQDSPAKESLLSMADYAVNREK